jgi:hypothetical protein
MLRYRGFVQTRKASGDTLETKLTCIIRARTGVANLKSKQISWMAVEFVVWCEGADRPISVVATAWGLMMFGVS